MVTSSHSFNVYWRFSFGNKYIQLAWKLRFLQDLSIEEKEKEPKVVNSLLIILGLSVFVMPPHFCRSYNFSNPPRHVALLWALLTPHAILAPRSDRELSNMLCNCKAQRWSFRVLQDVHKQLTSLALLLDGSCRML